MEAKQSEFAKWIDSLIGPKVRNQQELANKIGMTLSAFTRGVERGSLGVENLLHLAEIVEEHPSTVLRLAGKGTLAALIERLYGSGQKALRKSQRDWLELFEQLEPESRRVLLEQAEHMRDLSRRGGGDGMPRARKGAAAGAVRQLGT